VEDGASRHRLLVAAGTALFDAPRGERPRLLAAAANARRCWVKVEDYNGTVAFAEPVSTEMGAVARPPDDIFQHELGHSAGANYGRFNTALALRALCKRYGTVNKFADAVEQAFRNAGVPF
jgi:hypothetical protein